MKKLNFDEVADILLQILQLIVLGGLILGLSFWLVLMGAVAGSPNMAYIGYALAILGFPLTVVSIFSQWVKPKIKVRLWWCLPVLILTPIIIKEAYQIYDNSFTRVSEAGLEVADYQPFMDSTKAVYLNEPSSLALTDPLPKLDGARALYPLYSAFAQAVYPKRQYSFESEVGYTNTIDAYKRLIKRNADIIFVVSPSKEQQQNAQDKGVEIKFTAIGQDAFVFFVNAKNPVDNLTSEQLRAIYSGKITNWKQVGGNNESIKAFQRNEGSGSQSAFLAFMQDTPVMKPRTEDIHRGMGSIITMTSDYANYANAIGFSFRYFSQSMIANNEIKLLSIDGVYPSVETIASGTYPLSVKFYAASLANNNKPEVQKMIEWILSPQGQSLVEKTGYVRVE